MFDICYQFLFAGLKLVALTIELALSLCEGALVLPQALCRGYCPTKEGLLYGWITSELNKKKREGRILAMMFMEEGKWV